MDNDVVFNLNNPRSEKSAIRCCLSINGQRYRSQVGISVKTKYWDLEKHRAKLTSSYRDALIVNHKLNEWEGAVQRVIHNTTLKNIDISNEEIFWSYVTCEIKNQPYIIKANESQSFTEYIETVYIPRFVGRKAQKRIDRFKSILEILKEFEQKKYKILLSKVGVEFYREFQDFCYNDKQYTINYYGTIIKIVKQFMKEAVEVDKLTNNEDYKKSEFKAPSAAVDTEYVSIAELEKLYSLDIDALINEYYPLASVHGRKQRYKTFETVRNLFLIGAFTGLRVSDFTTLKNYHFRDNKMVKVTGKDKDQVVIPIHPIIQEILDSGFDYGSQVSEKTNREYIKLLCKYAGFTEDVEIRVTKGGVITTEVHPRYQLISTHTCRRSFATNAVIVGIPIAHIMMITGHSREADFWRYVRIKKSQIADLIADSKFFKRTADEEVQP